MSSKKNQQENLISIEEFIARAKRFGVDFGNGDPKNRLRYYVKMGLLPHAQRKSFNGSPPNGAYSEKELTTLFEINKQLKAGKTVQEIKREKKEKFFQPSSGKIINSFSERSPISSFLNFQDNFWQKNVEPEPVEETDVDLEKVFQIEEKLEFDRKKNAFKIPVFLKIFFLILFLSSIGFLTSFKINYSDSLSYFLAAINQFAGQPTRLAQLSSDDPLRQQTLSSPFVEPFLTINAETIINAELTVKETLSASGVSLIDDQFKGLIAASGLTADREYGFPNLSGTVCLTTGNCIGLAGEVTTTGGTANRLTKFISGQEIANSSINDLYLGGAAINISAAGNVGIGTANPLYSLHVDGRIQATGDICTNLVGGRCLSTLPLGGGGGSVTTIIQGSDLDGSGSENYLALWSSASALADSIIYQLDENIGIGTTTPGYTLTIDGTFAVTGTSTFSTNVGIGTTTPEYDLDVDGTIRTIGFRLPTSASLGYVLTSDADGYASWQPTATGSLPEGTMLGQTLRYSGASWLVDSFLYNTGSALGIGTTSVSSAVLTVNGTSSFHGPMTIQDSSLVNQLVLKYDDDNLLSFFVNGEKAEISSSKTMFINSLTGQIALGSDVNLFNAYNATIAGATFVSTTTDSTVRKSGEIVFQGSVPIFVFPFPAQTTSTEFIALSKEMSPAGLNLTLPDELPGATRKFAFLANFADDILATASSTWLVEVSGGSDTEFYFAGQNLAQFDQGNPFLSDFVSPPTNNWQLKVKVPLNNKIRIFNVLLLVYDEIN
jgi:DNA-binding transcriptional MerR regulator